MHPFRHERKDNSHWVLLNSLRSSEVALRVDGTNPLGQQQQSDRMKYIGLSLGTT